MRITDTAHRLNELMSEYGLRQQDLANRTGISKATISHYVKNEREPKQDKIAVISKAFDVDPAWLMGFDVPMKKNKYGSGAADAEIVFLYGKLSDENKKKALDYIQYLLDRQS